MLKRVYRLLHPKFQKVVLDYPVDARPRYGHGRPAHPGLLDVVEAQRGRYETLIDAALTHRDALQGIRDAAATTDPHAPAWNNGFLPGLDVVAIYTMLATYAPARYVEIGSGNSTKVARKAIRERGLPTRVTSIDPAPRAEIDDLADEVIRQPFETLDRDLAAELEPGDVLFVDNSHRLLPNSDATVFFLEVLPRLRPGVIVHVHDVYLPYDYPQFMCDRFYSEQYGLAMFLLAAPEKYRVLWPGYFISEDATLSERIEPMWAHPNLAGVERHGGSFWFEIA